MSFHVIHSFPELAFGEPKRNFRFALHICTPMMSCVSGSEEPSGGIHFVSFRSAARLVPLCYISECGESLAALEYFGLRQFIAALVYFGQRRVHAPPLYRDTSRVALGVRYG